MRILGITRASTKIGLDNMVYDMKGFLLLKQFSAPRSSSDSRTLRSVFNAEENHSHRNRHLSMQHIKNQEI